MKAIRISILLIIFVVAAFYTKLQRIDSMAWIDTLSVSIYPINADGDPRTDAYIEALTNNSFRDIDVFFQKQWGVYSEFDFLPVSLQLKTAITSQPPMPPENGNVLSVMLWSLKLRYWAYQHAVDDERHSINIFVRYHQPDNDKPLAHSLGLQKGLIGVVNAYADNEYQARNHLVIAHELLHTVGAADKYNLVTGQPIYPDGFARPENHYEQFLAEIMAGRLPLSLTESVMAESLRLCVIGEKTALEIGWKE